jgi:hypothetical protein
MYMNIYTVDTKFENDICILYNLNRGTFNSSYKCMYFQMFIGDHYVGRDIHFSVQDGEHWKKTLGPIFIYLNSNPNQNQSGTARDLLWQDAKAQVRAHKIPALI